MKKLLFFIIFSIIITSFNQAAALIKCFRSPQYGGNGGGSFSDDLTEINRITKVTIRHGAVIDSIQTTWLSTTGATVVGTRYGGDGGNSTEFTINDGENICKIEGRSGGSIDQLTFYTDKGRQFGPYGGNGGEKFEILCPDGFNGFFGRADKQFVYSLGVFIPKR